MRIVLFGPPGVGKGTQADLLSERLGLEHISTGVILRRAMRAGTPVGLEARRYITAGELVPDDVVRKLAEDAIAAQGFDRFILDGYPRTRQQADWLRAFLTSHDAPLHAVISLKAPDEVIIDRLSKRRINRETGENYHLDLRPPPPDVDPSLIIQRADDRPEAIRHRLNVYYEQTQPVEEHYRACGELFEVNGVGGFEEVYQRILSVLQQTASVD